VGSHRRDAKERRAVRLTRVAQVVPAVPSFAVDDGFTYSIPDALGDLDVGDIVRVPLGGRRVRGYVTSVGEGVPGRRLRDITARSGKQGVFTPAMLRSLRWTAAHYVAPLSTVLDRCAPPNLPGKAPRPSTGTLPPPGGLLAAWSTEPASGRPAFVLSGNALDAVESAITPVVARGKNVIVTAPTVAEAHLTADALRDVFGTRVRSATSDESAATRTTAWGRLSAGTGAIVIGTREVAFWGKDDLGLVVVIDEGRRAYKSPRTPTYHVRDVLRERSAVEGFPLALTGAVPTSEAMAAEVDLYREPPRIWPHVEVVDRSAASFGRGAVGDAATRAIAALGPSGTVFVLVPRRGGSFRCARCRELRRCGTCEATLTRDGRCPRCGAVYPVCTACGGTRFEGLGGGVTRIVDDLRRRFGSDAGPADGPARIAVGTERDLVGLPPVDLVVVVDPDAGILAPTYRADEEALRLLARAVLAAKPGGGRRAVIQTSLPEHPVFIALRKGDPIPFLHDTLAARASSGFPPIGDLIAIEADAESATGTLAEATGDATLLGPAPEGERFRWLIQGRDLSVVRIRLRAAVQHLRDGGTRVRVDVDPVDL